MPLGERLPCGAWRTWPGVNAALENDRIIMHVRQARVYCKKRRDSKDLISRARQCCYFIWHCHVCGAIYSCLFRFMPYHQRQPWHLMLSANSTNVIPRKRSVLSAKIPGCTSTRRKAVTSELIALLLSWDSISILMHYHKNDNLSRFKVTPPILPPQWTPSLTL